MCCSIHVIKLVMYDIFHVLKKNIYYIYIYIYISKNILAIIFCFTWNIISSLKSTFLAIFRNHPLCSCFLRSCQYHRWTTTQRCWVAPSGILPLSEATPSPSAQAKRIHGTSRCDEVLVGKCFITSQMAVWNKPPILSRNRGLLFSEPIPTCNILFECKAYLY